MRLVCPNCGYVFDIDEKEICKSSQGEYFVSCRNPRPYFIGDVPKCCNGYIPIPIKSKSEPESSNEEVEAQSH